MVYFEVYGKDILEVRESPTSVGYLKIYISNDLHSVIRDHGFFSLCPMHWQYITYCIKRWKILLCFVEPKLVVKWQRHITGVQWTQYISELLMKTYSTIFMICYLWHFKTTTILQHYEILFSMPDVIKTSCRDFYQFYHFFFS